MSLIDRPQNASASVPTNTWRTAARVHHTTIRPLRPSKKRSDGGAKHEIRAVESTKSLMNLNGYLALNKSHKKLPKTLKL